MSDLLPARDSIPATSSVSSPEHPALTGVVLCGGASTRMGTDKALLNIDGQPLVLRVTRVLSEVADPVLLAPGTPGRLGDLGYPEVGDAVQSSGPLGGMVASLRWSPHDLTAVVAVDMPFANPDVIRLLASLAGEYDAVVPVTSNGPQPLHAVYARSALPVLERALVEGSLSVKGALQQLSVRWVGRDEWKTADPSGTFALNLNQPDDMAKIRAGLDPTPPS
jgi:molybdopterin-guanine dinucleotide biosynthesis protein A